MPPTGGLSPAEIAAICLSVDGVETHTSRKLCSCGLDQTEALYMALAYGFDAQRKMQYLCRILLRVAKEHAAAGAPDPELQRLARELLADEHAINRPGLSWRQRAEATEARMLELHSAITEDRDRLLAHFAGESGSQSA